MNDKEESTIAVVLVGKFYEFILSDSCTIPFHFLQGFT